MPPGVLGVLMMPKRNDRPLFILIIILLFALAALCGVSGSSLGREAAPDTEYTEHSAAPSLESSLYSRELENAEASVRLEAFDLGRSGDGSGEFRLDVEIYNKTPEQYEYEVCLSDFSSSLVYMNAPGLKGYDISYSDNYSRGERRQGETYFYFVPDGGEASDGYAGRLGLYFQQNVPAARNGSIKITISVQDSRSRPVSIITHVVRFDFR